MVVSSYLQGSLIVSYSAAVNCGRLNAPGNGVIVVRDTTLGAVAIYTCDPSFRLVGVESRVCQENGSWSGETPICEG